MKKGTLVRIKSTGRQAKVIHSNDTAVHVEFDDGSIEKFATDAIEIILTVERLFRFLKPVVKFISRLFK